MIVYEQPQNLEVKRNEDYHLIVDKIKSGLDYIIQITNNKLSIFTEIDFRTQHSCFRLKNSVIAVMIALLQGV